MSVFKISNDSAVMSETSALINQSTAFYFGLEIIFTSLPLFMFMKNTTNTNTAGCLEDLSYLDLLSVYKTITVVLCFCDDEILCSLKDY